MMLKSGEDDDLPEGEADGVSRRKHLTEDHILLKDINKGANNMKKNYAEPEMEVIELDCRDMILTSACLPLCEEAACVCDAATGVVDDSDWEDPPEKK